MYVHVCMYACMYAYMHACVLKGVDLQVCDQNCKCATKYRARVRRDDLEPECMHDPMSVGEKPTAIAITGTTTMTTMSFVATVSVTATVCVAATVAVTAIATVSLLLFMLLRQLVLLRQ